MHGRYLLISLIIVIIAVLAVTITLVIGRTRYSIDERQRGVLEKLNKKIPSHAGTIWDRIKVKNSKVILISLAASNTTDDDLRLLEAFPDLEALYLSSTQVTEKGLIHLVGLKKLVVLDLPFKVTDDNLIILKQLPNLRTIN